MAQLFKGSQRPLDGNRVFSSCFSEVSINLDKFHDVLAIHQQLSRDCEYEKKFVQSPTSILVYRYLFLCYNVSTWKPRSIVKF